MNALAAGGIQRSSSTGTIVTTSHPRIASSDPAGAAASRDPPCHLAEASRPAVAERCAETITHVLEGRVLIALPAPGLDGGDLVDDVHPLGDAPEDGVAEIARAVVEEGVVGEVDEELRGGAVDLAGARHGERAALVLQAVLRLVADRRMRALVAELRIEPAALDDEARHDAVKDRAVEMPLIDVAQKILHAERRLLGEELHRERAVRGLESNQRCIGHWPSVMRSRPARSRCERT